MLTQSALVNAMTHLPIAHEWYALFGYNRSYTTIVKESVFSKKDIPIGFRLQKFVMGNEPCYEWVVILK